MIYLRILHTTTEYFEDKNLNVLTNVPDFLQISLFGHFTETITMIVLTFIGIYPKLLHNLHDSNERVLST